MKPLKEDDLLASLFLDLKGPKKKRNDWISIAEKCREIIRVYGSIESAAEKLGVSYELLRSIATLLTLPDEVKNLIRKGDILYDASQRLYKIRDPKKQIEIARVIAGLPSHKQREIIQYAVKYPDSNIDSFKKRVTKPTKRVEKIHVVVIPLSQEIYDILDKTSGKSGISLEKMILKIINEWSERGSKA